MINRRWITAFIRLGQPQIESIVTCSKLLKFASLGNFTSSLFCFTPIPFVFVFISFLFGAAHLYILHFLLFSGTREVPPFGLQINTVTTSPAWLLVYSVNVGLCSGLYSSMFYHRKTFLCSSFPVSL